MSAITERVLELLPDARLHKLGEVEKDREIIIWGPPGTGKTTSLMTLVDSHLQKGAPSVEVMVATFTRNARAEVKSRLGAKFGLDEQDLPWVRTIHSAAYRLLDLNSTQVMDKASLEVFGRETKYEIRGQLVQRSVDDPFGSASIETPGDWFYVAEELRRAKLLTYRQAVQTFTAPDVVARDWNERGLEAFSTVYANWKRSQKLLDFTDMLEQAVEEGVGPPVRWMFVDEAQDLTPLQWKVIDSWAKTSNRLFIFGDDDQAIYQFAGADPAALWARPGHQFVLSHSYRLADQVHAEANRIIGRTKERVLKRFEPHSRGGEIASRWGWEELDYTREGSWLLLGRNRVFLEECRNALMDQGVPFRDRTSWAGIPLPETSRGQAVRALLDLHEGRLITKRSARHVRDQVRPALWNNDRIKPQVQVYALLDLVDAGADSKLVEIISQDPLRALNITGGEYDYLRQVLRRGGQDALTSRPRVELSTIHGVKGEEADHVVVSTAMTRRTHDDYKENPDPEHRCFYVAVTRAKQSLTWLQGGPSRGFYEV